MPTNTELAPEAAFDLYAHSNGMMVIREKAANGSSAWKSHPVGTSVEEKARKRFAAFLKKKGVKDIDPLKSPIMSAIGVIPTNSGMSVARFIENNRPAVLPRGGRHDGAGKRRDYSAEHARRKVSPPRHDSNIIVEARELVNMLAANLAAAALCLKKLEEIISEGD